MDEYSEFLEQLKRRASILDVASKYAQFSRKGTKYWACCPMHVEKTPSFCLDEDRQSFYCFGCHKHGDVLTLVEEMEKVDFNGAVDLLADKYGMEKPSFTGSKNKGEYAKIKGKKERLYNLMKDAANHYFLNLMSQKGNEAREYLHNRGISDETIKKFGLGYCIDSKDLIKYLLSKGYTYEEMEEAKVAFKGGKSAEYYDPQHERFIVPIVDSQGRVIAFGGRVVLNVDHTQKKYYNSMESLIYHKSNELFAANIVKSLRNINTVILVEGYMDVISLYQAGIQNAVASCGTALTPEQALLIKRFANKVYFMYDGDSAGQAGILRGIELLKQAGLDVYVVVLPEDQDPDSYVRKFGGEKMKELIKNAIPMYEYKINNVAKKYDLKSVEERGKFATEAIEAIADTSKVQADPFIRKIEKLTAIDSQVLYEQLDKFKQGKKINIVPKQQEKFSDAYTKCLRFILYAAFGGVEGLQVEDEFLDCCRSEETKDLYSIFRASQGELTIDDLKSLKDENSEVEPILAIGSSVKEDAAKKMFNDCRRKVLTEWLAIKQKELANAIDNETDDSIKLNLQQQLNQLLLFKRKI